MPDTICIGISLHWNYNDNNIFLMKRNKAAMCCLSALRIGASVVILLAAAAAPSVASETLRIGGTGAALGLVRELGAGFAERHGNLVVEVPPSLGSSGGIRALLAGVLDLAVTSRPLNADERQRGAMEVAIGTTPLVFVTSRSDTNGNISSGDLVALFGLTLRNWPDGTPAHIVVRSKSETDFHLVAQGIAGMGPAWARAWAEPGLPHAYTDQDNLDLAEELPGSLAVAALATVLTEKRQVARLALDGVSATVENLQLGSYRLAKSFYLVSAAHESPLAAEFVAFVRGPQGHRIMLASGTLPASP